MKLVLLAIPLLLGAIPAGMIWDVFDPGSAKGCLAGVRRVVGGFLALVAYAAGAAAGLMVIR